MADEQAVPTCSLDPRIVVRASTIDYATHSRLAEFRMPCACGAPQCRGVVTGDDWRLPELQHRYGDHWVRGLRARIASS